MQTSVAGAAFGVKDTQNKGQNEKNPGQPAGEFCQHVGRLRTENILGDPPTKRRAETLTFRPLHQNDQCHQHRNQHVDSEQNVDENVHRSGQYRQIALLVNAERAALSSQAPNAFEMQN